MKFYWKNVKLISFWLGLQIPSAAGGIKFEMIDAKLYGPVVTLLTEDNAKLLQQLIPGSQRTIKWNKDQPKISTERQNQYLDFLMDPGFQGVDRLFILFFANENDTEVSTRYYFLKIEIKDYNVMIDKHFWSAS